MRGKHNFFHQTFGHYSKFLSGDPEALRPTFTKLARYVQHDRQILDCLNKQDDIWSKSCCFLVVSLSRDKIKVWPNHSKLSIGVPVNVFNLQHHFMTCKPEQQIKPYIVCTFNDNDMYTKLQQMTFKDLPMITTVQQAYSRRKLNTQKIGWTTLFCLLCKMPPEIPRDWEWFQTQFPSLPWLLVKKPE